MEKHDHAIAIQVLADLIHRRELLGVITNDQAFDLMRFIYEVPPTSDETRQLFEAIIKLLLDALAGYTEKISPGFLAKQCP